ncbi:MAG: mechanosensitive ion channel family protein [Flavobacteriaceae bacterium]
MTGTEAFQSALDAIRTMVGSLSSVWIVYQLALIAVCLAIAFALGRWLRRYAARVDVSGVARTFLRHATPVIFMVLVWGAYLAIREATWPSRSYLIGVAANLATAWVVIYFVARLVPNRLLFWIITAGAFSIAALSIVGLLEPTLNALNAIGFSVGQTRYTALSVLKAVVLVTLLLVAASRLGRFGEMALQKTSDLSPSAAVLIAKIVRIVLFVVAVVVAMSVAGIDLTGIAVLSGAVGVGIGFGLQKVVSNLVSGFILLLDRSIKPGDVIELGETFGWIGSLGARYVSVVTRDGKEYLIPNEDLITQRVINWSFSNARVRLEVRFGVSYEADPHEVRKIAVEAAKGAKRVLEAPAPVCHLAEFGDSSVNYLLRFWIEDPAFGVANIRGEVLLGLWDRLHEKGIEIPYPKRDVAIRGPVEVRVSSDRKSRGEKA